MMWIQRPRCPHILDGKVAERKVASIFLENHNPLRPRGCAPLARPFTLEVYLPMRPGVDKVRKFTALEAAQVVADAMLNQFVADVS